MHDSYLSQTHATRTRSLARQSLPVVSCTGRFRTQLDATKQARDIDTTGSNQTHCAVIPAAENADTNRILRFHNVASETKRVRALIDDEKQAIQPKKQCLTSNQAARESSLQPTTIPEEKIIAPTKSEEPTEQNGDKVRVVNIPEDQIDRSLPLIEQILDYYHQVAAYWPSDMISFEKILRPHKYYMEALNFLHDEQPNLIVFCESHANSPDVGEVECTEHLPFGYVSLVHCLAYGESHLLSGGNLAGLRESEKKSIHKGTLNFWKLFSVLAGFQDVRSDGTDPLESNDCFAFLMAGANRKERLSAKKTIIQRLKDRRIALVDASLFPIYHGAYREYCINKTTAKTYYTPMNPLKKKKLVSQHLKVSWKSYAKPLIDCFKPRNVLILSKGLGARAENRDKTLSDYGGQYHGARIHPSAHMSNANRLAELAAIRKITLSCLS